MRLKEFIKKTVLPTLGAYMTVNTLIKNNSEKDIVNYENLNDVIETAIRTHKANLLAERANYELSQYVDTVNKQDIFHGISNLIDDFKQYLDTLSADQLVALFNIFGYYMISQALISICLILLGDSVIQKFNLEIRFPKLSKFIKFRAKANRVYLSVYIIILISVLLVFSSVNVLMLINYTY